MERIFSKIELNKIINENYNNPVFKYQNCELMYNENTPPATLISVSKKNCLLLTMGNSDTGNKHIIERHSFWSTKTYINETNKEKKFQNQSRFSKDLVPFEYLEIADNIYLKENKINNTKNNKFDVYEAKILVQEKNEKFRLILYKGTKVIHTLYPVNAKNNRKKNKHYPFERGKVKVIRNGNIQKVLIPYLNTEYYCKYGILIEKNYEKETEIISLNLFKKVIIKWDKHFNFIEFLKQDIVKFECNESATITYQHTDLRQIEKVIVRVDNLLLKYKIPLGENFEKKLQPYRKELNEAIYNTV